MRTSGNIKSLLGRLLAGLFILGMVAGALMLRHNFAFAPVRPFRYQADPLLTPAADTLKFQVFDVTVEDTLTLRGWFVSANDSVARGTIIVLHGIGSSKETMIGQAKLFANAGFNSILFDLRANGKSGGYFTTYGWYERNDVRTYIDEAQKRFGNVGPFGIFGNSLGAAVSLEAMAFDSRICCGVVQSPFGTLREIVRDYMHHDYKIPFRFVSDFVLNESGRLAHFPVDSIDIVHAASTIDRPVMVVYGLKDRNIDSHYGQQVFAALRSAQKSSYVIPEGEHNTLWRAGGIEYQKALLAFFHSHMH